jgi:hypothetical protein
VRHWIEVNKKPGDFFSADEILRKRLTENDLPTSDLEAVSPGFTAGANPTLL